MSSAVNGMAVWGIVGILTTLRAPMEEIVSAAEANRDFSRMLRGVREGLSYVVTCHGQPIARLVHMDKFGAVPSGARATLLSRLRNQPLVHAGRWTRDELYEDEG